MVRGKVVVLNAAGLHARSANRFVSETQNFESSIHILKKGVEFNAKSIIRVLAACVKHGEEIEIVCQGPDEAESLKAVLAAVEAGLGE